MPVRQAGAFALAFSCPYGVANRLAGIASEIRALLDYLRECLFYLEKRRFAMKTPPLKLTKEEKEYEAIAHETHHLCIVAALLDDAANCRYSYAGRAVELLEVQKHAAWLHQAVVKFEEMVGRVPEPLFGPTLLEAFNTWKDSPNFLTNDHLLALATAIADEQRVRAVKR
jgi:hypothetical protein